MKRRLSVTVFLFLAFSLGALYAQENLTRDVLLSERWSNDEFSFDFSPVGTVVSYYTAGDREGTLRGKWRRSNEGVTLRNLNLEGDYPEDFIENGSMVLDYRYDENDPKASQRLQAGEEGQLRVWNKDSFTEEERALYLEDPYREEAIEAVTTGYELTATTFNLRLRQGPGTDYEYQIYTYFDVKSGSVKTFTSMWAGTNLRILARTAEKQQVGKWYNYWYYVEYKEPAGDMIVYRNAWMFGEFLDVAENKDRWVRIDYPQNEAALYNDYQVGIEGVTAGSPMSVNIQVKNSLGVVIKDVPVDDYDQVAGTFSHTISKRDETLYIGSNTINLVAEYSDFSKISKQITFYVHESMGERAKPVIYLYPPRETDVRVEVSPQSGFSFTEPEYGEGWEVRATPEGLITNREDGKTWPYLFWESNSESRPETKEGFVVKREDLDSFFRDKLTFMGLIPREIEDFLEYWIPVLNEGPWYYISFIDQATQDAEAPLTITPRPDTIIRVFFDSRPLVEPISVPEQELKKGKREGFTVIEWGGMRYHN